MAGDLPLLPSAKALSLDLLISVLLVTKMVILSLTGELYAIYLLADVQRAGLGKELFYAGVERFRQRGLTATTTLALEGNASARAFYHRMGMIEDGGTQRDQIGGQDVLEIRYSLPLR